MCRGIITYSASILNCSILQLPKNTTRYRQNTTTASNILVRQFSKVKRLSQLLIKSHLCSQTILKHNKSKILIRSLSGQGDEPCGQSYKHFTLVNYDSRVMPDWKISHIMILEL